MSGPQGSTQVAAVIGHPVRHSLSPALLNAAFAAAELDWVFVAFDVEPGYAAAAVEAVRALGLGGLSVTMPHKAAVAEAVDDRDDDATVLRAVNCVAWQGRGLVGHNTDGAGFLDALRVDQRWDPAGQRCAVLGAGGAARAVIRALGQAGAADVVVVNRTAERGHQAAALAGAVGRVGGAEAVAGADLVVNATPVGMGSGGDGGPGLPVDPARLSAGQLVVDLIYHPLETPLLAAAGAAGATAVNGVGMLVHQAGHAFRWWTGHAPPLDAMKAAALAQLPARDRP